MSLPVLSCGLQERRVALGRLETLRVGAKSARLATPWAGSRPQNVAVLCLKRLEVDGLLGRGSFGYVVAARDLGGACVAMKQGSPGP